MRSQKHLAPVSFTLALVLSQTGVIPLASAIPNPIDNGNQRAQLPTTRVPPTRRPAPGNRTPGGGLGGPPVCPITPQELTAITPIDVHGNTLSASPTFWFYVPYTAAEVESGEFSVLTEDESERVYKTTFKLPDQPGFVSITLPETADLQAGAYYHWYLQLACDSDSDAKTPLNIDGWVQRIPATPELDGEIETLSSEVWYDSLDYLAKQLQNGTGSRQAWDALLSSVGLDELTQAPVIGPVTLPEDEPAAP